MGRNSKRNKAITKLYLPQLKKYCEQLEQQLEQIKTDPNTTLGQVINQARELYTQNSRLSVLTAALIDRLGAKVPVKKSEMDKFENHRIVIKWELPDGVEKPEDAEEFVFSYSAEKNEQPTQVGPVAHTTENRASGELVTPVVTEASICGDAAAAIDSIPEAVANATLEFACDCFADPNCLHGAQTVVPDVAESVDDQPEQVAEEITE